MGGGGKKKKKKIFYLMVKEKNIPRYSCVFLMLYLYFSLETPTTLLVSFKIETEIS